MEEQNQHIDQYFREQLGDYTEQPDASVWDALEKRLDERPRRRGFFWIWLLGFLVAAGLTLFTYNNPRTGRQIIHPITSTQHEPVSKVATHSENSMHPVQEAGNIPVPYAPAISTRSYKPAKSNRKSRTTFVQHAPAPRQVRKPADATGTPVIQTTVKETGVPISSETTGKESTSESTITTSLSTPQVNTSPATENPSKSHQPDETDYQQLQPVAGKMKNNNTQQLSTEEYNKLVPSAGKAVAAKSSRPSVIQKSKTEPAAVQQIVSATPIEQKQNISPAAKPNIEDVPKETDAQKQVINTGSPLKTITTISTDSQLQPNTKQHIHRFSAGIKAGYEFGVVKPAANKIVASACLQYHFNSRWSLMLQPAAKYARYTAAELSRTTSYKITDTSRYYYTPSKVIITTGQEDYMIYKETYDSIITTRNIPSVYKWQLDIPLLLNYKLFHNLEIYGGPNINIAGIIKTQENTRTFSGIQRTDTILLHHNPFNGQYDTPSISNIFNHPVSNLDQPNTSTSTYNPAPVNSSVVNPFRLGLTFGATYVFRNRFTLDIQYIQAVTGAGSITDQKLKNAYYQPYIRMTLGYRFMK